MNSVDATHFRRICSGLLNFFKNDSIFYYSLPVESGTGQKYSFNYIRFVGEEKSYLEMLSTQQNYFVLMLRILEPICLEICFLYNSIFGSHIFNLCWPVGYLELQESSSSFFTFQRRNTKSYMQYVQWFLLLPLLSAALFTLPEAPSP